MDLKEAVAIYGTAWGAAPLDYHGLKRILDGASPTDGNDFFFILDQERQRINA